MNKLAALWGLFRKGEAVANPALWKTGQITATMLGSLILAIINLAKSFGYDIPIDSDSANVIGASVLIITNCVLTVTTTPHIGLPAKDAANEADTPSNVFGGRSD